MSDGAAAVVLASERAVRRLGLAPRPVKVRASVLTRGGARERGPRQVSGARLAFAETGGGLRGIEDAAVSITVLECP